MNIAILGLTATSYGSLTYLKNLLPCLAKIDHANHYEVLLPAASAREPVVRQENFQIQYSRWAPRSGTLRVLWEQLILPWIFRARRVDVVYTTQNLAILLSPTPSVIIIQNVEPFFAGQFPNSLHLRARLWLLGMMSKVSLRRSRCIIAISDWEKDLLVDRFQLPPDKIVVSYPGVTEGFCPPTPDSASSLREHLGLEPPYILCVTRLAGYGNFLNLAKAYISLARAGKVTMPLVVPGEVWDARYIGQIKKMVKAEGLADRVKFLGYVPHRLMPLLFGHAACFVFPSLLEACGMALIEALACGTPILCCRRRPMTDICRDAAVYFEGDDSADIAAKILELLTQPCLREGLSRRAVTRAAEFSWQRGAEKVHQVFEQLARESDAARAGGEPIPPERRP